MTRDEIIRWAKQAGWERVGRNPSTGPEYPVLITRLERFAALVAAAEREACAELCEKRGAVFATDGSSMSSIIHENEARQCADMIRAWGKI